MSIWKNFDQIVCICLATRDDRYSEQKTIFDSVDIPVTFYRPEKHKNGMQGCFESHINVITDCYNKGMENVLIFEDDATPTSYFTPDNMKECVSFMYTNFDWEILFLGSNILIGQGTESTTYPHIYRSRFLNAHAYVINRKAMEKYANMKFISEIDVVYSINHHTYGFLPSIFNQRLSKSDIASNKDYMGLKNSFTHHAFQSINNYYGRYIGYYGKSILEVILVLLIIFIYYNPYYKGKLVILFLSLFIVYKIVERVCYLQRY
ncbi:MAG: glycosyltransferase family 25 protein [Candidatus Colwellbacteria bacterium]|nr:glycosyltransferase family 25 protein [Candidatus Colwellbacteria bacterium]